MFEPLENRRLLAVTTDFSAGTLTVTGDNEPNAVGISRNDLGQLVVRAGDSIIRTIAYADVQRIVVSLLGGNDRLEIAQRVERPTTISGGEGNDSLHGGGSHDSINGGAGNDLLRGGWGRDTLSGSDGNDLLEGGPQADLMSGGGGLDIVSYAERGGAVRVTLDNETNDGEIGTPGEGDNVRNDIERIVGGRGADYLSGVGAPGGVFVEGGAGRDQIFGGSGNDVLSGGSGHDSLFGNEGFDTLTGGTGGDRFSGGAGLDLVTYAERETGVVVTIDGEPNDGTPATSTFPGERDNVLTDVERLGGGRAGDRLTGSNANNTIGGGAGNDTILGLGGDDVIEGSSGHDLVQGGAGNDSIYGGSGEDRLFGDDGNDSFFARDGRADLVDGGSGEDRAQVDPELDVRVSIEILL